MASQSQYYKKNITKTKKFSQILMDANANLKIVIIIRKYFGKTVIFTFCFYVCVGKFKKYNKVLLK